MSEKDLKVLDECFNDMRVLIENAIITNNNVILNKYFVVYKDLLEEWKDVFKCDFTSEIIEMYENTLIE